MSIHISKSVEDEYGSFHRRIWREGKKKHTKTVKPIKNEEKVTLGFIGQIEVYVLPYSFPDRVFFGLYPYSTSIDKNDVSEIQSAYNKTRSFLREDWQIERRRGKGANARREAIVTAYNYGLESQKQQESGSPKHNYNYDYTEKEVVYKCPKCKGEVWFNTAGELIRHAKHEKHGKIIVKKSWASKVNGKWRVVE